MNFLLLGDVCGKSGMNAIKSKLKNIITTYKINFTIINGENAADNGKGLTKENFNDLIYAGADVVTTGNHVWIDVHRHRRSGIRVSGANERSRAHVRRVRVRDRGVTSIAAARATRARRRRECRNDDDDDERIVAVAGAAVAQTSVHRSRASVLLHAQQGAIFRDALRGIIARVGDGTRRTHQEKHDGFILERRHRRRCGDAVAVGDTRERGAKRAASVRSVPGAGYGRSERDVRAVRRRQTDSSASPDALRALRAAAVRRASVGARASRIGGGGGVSPRGMGHRHVVLQSESGECVVFPHRGALGETNSRLQ